MRLIAPSGLVMLTDIEPVINPEPLIPPLPVAVSATVVPVRAARLMAGPVVAVLEMEAVPEAVNASLSVTVLPVRLSAPVEVPAVPEVIAPVVLTVRAWLAPPKVRS